MPRIIKIHLKINGSIDRGDENEPRLLQSLVIGFKAPKPFSKTKTLFTESSFFRMLGSYCIRSSIFKIACNIFTKI